jgi:flagellar assembly protein FliH
MSKPAPTSNILNGTGAVVSAWTLPEVDGPAANRRREQAGEDKRTLDAQKKVQDDAFAQGHAVGVAAGQAEFAAKNQALQQHIDALDSAIQFLAKPLEQLDAQVERELVNLALTVAKHLVRRELKIDPAQVIAIIRETVALLPAAARDVRVHLHPEDAALVRERLAAPQAERAWTIIEDPMLARGGCKVTTDTANIDARLETRIASVVASLLGDERVDSNREART